MKASPTQLRIGSVLVVLAVVAVVFVIGAPGDEPGPAPAPPRSESPSSPPLPTPSSVSGEEFCTAFRAMAAAHSNHLANDTEASLLELTAATETLLRLTPGTAMPPGARQGVEELVAGVLGEGPSAPDEAAADAFTVYLETSCPGGA